MSTRGAAANAGFTLVEMVCVIVMLVPIMAAIMSTSGIVKSSVATSQGSADTLNAMRWTNRRLTTLLRPALVASIRRPATAQDVEAAEENAKMADPEVPLPIPRIGDWIEVSPGSQPSSRLQFRARREGVTTTAPRELAFVLDESEIRNGRDDDGDGLVDEGNLVLTDAGSPGVVLMTRLLQFEFTMDGHVAEFFVGCGRSDATGRVHRWVARFSVALRN